MFIAQLLPLVLATLAIARPMPDSSINEPAVSAPNGIPITDSVSATATVATVSAPEATFAPSSSSSSSNNYGYDSSDDDENDMMSHEDSSHESSSWESPSSESSYNKGSESSSGSSSSYGSGSSNWGSSGYDGCVQQCMSQYGQPPSEYKPTATSGSEGSKGNGATHTVIVAPSQGVLRYVPFVLNASVGDTILFHWNANTHTVTKSSALQPCNKTGDSLFTSGSHDKDFEFTQVVNDTDTTYFFCNTPGHCQKGMFGAINAPNSFGSPTSVTLAARDLAAKSPEVAAQWAKMEQDTKGNDAAANWGGNLDMKDIPDWAHQSFIENVMYTRTLLAANPEILKDDGRVDLSSLPQSPLKVPQDVTGVINAAAAPPAAAPATPAPGSAPPSASPNAVPASALGNGAGALASPRMLVAAAAAFVTFLAL